MHSGIVFVGFAAFAAASPAPQSLDLAALAATTVSAVGPPLASNTQTNVYDAAAAESSAGQLVSSVAQASGSAAPTAPAMVRRTWGDYVDQRGSNHQGGYQSDNEDDQGAREVSKSDGEGDDGREMEGGIQKGEGANYGNGWGGSSYTGWGSQPTSSASAKASSAASSASTYNPVTPTSSIYMTSTATTSSSSACPTTPEAGTFCGFINPEDACAPQPDGYGPKVVPDTVAAFEAYPPFHEQALAAVAPSGYAQTFKDLGASTSANSYLGLHTLRSYDTLGCSQWCDNTTSCTGFNLYIERDPALNPSDNCTTVSSITNYKCTLWGSGVEAASATNTGGFRGTFQVVVVGSDGYEKTNNTTPATPSGWTKPQNCHGHAHRHPSTCVGTKFFPGPYNPGVCASYAKAQNKKNEDSDKWASWSKYFYNPLKCNFFNAYMLKQDGRALGTYCSLHAKQHEPAEASYNPGWTGGHYYGVESSWSFCSAD